MKLLEFKFSLPGWMEDFLCERGDRFTTVKERMRFVVDMAQRNVQESLGGPFAAGIFDEHGTLIAPGVNLVTSSNCSILHAEIVAIILAQKRLGRYDIGAGGKSYYELVTSTEPCAMCFGAIPWSGISCVVCGARSVDAQSIGFDEGPKPSDWWKALQERKIKVVRDVLRQEAISVLKDYTRRGGLIYNAGKRK
ncbi:MAG: nucleoside deaminase [Caldiserica bacterium]|nr:nucleoside deaminase [Caldisericota bacterium]